MNPLEALITSIPEKEKELLRALAKHTVRGKVPYMKIAAIAIDLDMPVETVMKQARELKLL